MQKVFSILLVLSLLLIGCSGKTESAKGKGVDKEYQILTAKEEKIYKDFVKDLDINKLKKAEPLTIAKLYFQAGLDKKYDVQYALYTDKDGFIQWTKEDDAKFTEKERGTSDYLYSVCKNIGKGKFIETSEDQGYIEFISGDETKTKMGFQLMKNDNGIWQVRFLPMQ